MNTMRKTDATMYSVSLKHDRFQEARLFLRSVHSSRTRQRNKLTFSSSFRLAGDTSECLLSSGLLGGANPEPRFMIWLPLWQPSLASLCLLCRASRTGTSSKESVDSCVTIGWSRDASFRRHTLHRQDDWKRFFVKLSHADRSIPREESDAFSRQPNEFPTSFRFVSFRFVGHSDIQSEYLSCKEWSRS